ncbi:MAG: RHS repeat domain-containing protein [Vicinamibacteria bacterium]
MPWTVLLPGEAGRAALDEALRPLHARPIWSLRGHRPVARLFAMLLVQLQVLVPLPDARLWARAAALPIALLMPGVLGLRSGEPTPQTPLPSRRPGEGGSGHAARSRPERAQGSDALSGVTEYEYDELGKLTKVTQPAAPASGAGRPVTEYGYDESRNRVSQTDARQKAVSMTYDRLDRVDKRIQDGGLETTYNYDEDGREKLVRDPKGQTVTNGYDELGRLKSKAWAFAAGTIDLPWRYLESAAYSYDPNGNLTRVEEAVASGTDPLGAPVVTARTYDRLDRLTSETTTLMGGERTVGYVYYPNGLKRAVIDPDLRRTEYGYDGKNRLASATTDFDTPQAATTSYLYWPDDLLKEVRYANGTTATHAYDRADRLTSLSNTTASGSVVSSYVYGYDANGNRLSQVETNGGATETTSYGYDALNRLTSVTYPVDASFPGGRTVGYGYDAVGNRERETETDASGAVLADKQGIFDSLNRLTSLVDLVDPAGSTAFTWDRNGNQLSKTLGEGASATTTSYVYDVRDRLVEVQQSSSILSRFAYDFEGRRSRKIGSEGVRQYVYDDTSLYLEYDDASASVAKYDYGSDRLISLTRRDEPRRYFHLDGLRSVTNLTSDDGSTAASYHLDAWGNYRFPTELTASRNRFGFTGYQLDSETGLYNAKARYFDPQLGRFLTQDSYLGEIDNPPSLQRYFYGYANPTRFTDPTGNLSLDEIKSGVKWGKDFIVAAGGDLAQNAPARAGKIVMAAGEQAVDLGTESFFMAGDTVNLALGRDVPLASKLAHASGQRLAAGESVGDIMRSSATDIGLNAVTVGTYGTLKEQFSVAADYMSGNASVEQVESRLINAAGGAVLNVGLGMAGSKLAGEGWLGKPVSVPSPGTVLESVTQLPAKARATLESVFPERGSIQAAQLKGRIGEALTVGERFLRGEKVVGRQTTLTGGGARARFDFITQNRFTGSLKVVESKFGLSAELERGQPVVADVIRNTGSAMVRGRKGVQDFRALGFEGGSFRRGMNVSGLEFVEQRFPLLERVFDKLLF